MRQFFPCSIGQTLPVIWAYPHKLYQRIFADLNYHVSYWNARKPSLSWRIRKQLCNTRQLIIKYQLQQPSNDVETIKYTEWNAASWCSTCQVIPTWTLLINVKQYRRRGWNQMKRTPIQDSLNAFHVSQLKNKWMSKFKFQSTCLARSTSSATSNFLIVRRSAIFFHIHFYAPSQWWGMLISRGTSGLSISLD